MVSVSSTENEPPTAGFTSDRLSPAIAVARPTSVPTGPTAAKVGVPVTFSDTLPVPVA